MTESSALGRGAHCDNTTMHDLTGAQDFENTRKVLFLKMRTGGWTDMQILWVLLMLHIKMNNNIL